MCLYLHCHSTLFVLSLLFPKKRTSQSALPMARRKSLYRPTSPSCDSSPATRMTSSQAHKSSLSPGKKCRMERSRRQRSTSAGTVSHPRCKLSTRRTYLPARCPSWVKSRRGAVKLRCPLYPRKRTRLTTNYFHVLAPRQRDGSSREANPSSKEDDATGWSRHGKEAMSGESAEGDIAGE